MKKELKEFASRVYENSNIRYEIEGVFGSESFDNFKEEFVGCVEKCIDEYKKQIQQIVAKRTEKLDWLKEEDLYSERVKALASILDDLNEALKGEE